MCKESKLYLNVTGHSLGAGAAVLLSILLKPVYPDLKVYAFATPGKFLVIRILWFF